MTSFMKYLHLAPYVVSIVALVVAVYAVVSQPKTPDMAAYEQAITELTTVKQAIFDLAGVLRETGLVSVSEDGQVTVNQLGTRLTAIETVLAPMLQQPAITP